MFGCPVRSKKFYFIGEIRVKGNVEEHNLKSFLGLVVKGKYCGLEYVSIHSVLGNGRCMVREVLEEMVG